jgi:hypothetical protein
MIKFSPFLSNLSKTVSSLSLSSMFSSISTSYSQSHTIPRSLSYLCRDLNKNLATFYIRHILNQSTTYSCADMQINLHWEIWHQNQNVHVSLCWENKRMWIMKSLFNLSEKKHQHQKFKRYLSAKVYFCTSYEKTLQNNQDLLESNSPK